jgi:hypothetical protein
LDGKLRVKEESEAKLRKLLEAEPPIRHDPGPGFRATPRYQIGTALMNCRLV